MCLVRQLDVERGLRELKAARCQARGRATEKKGDIVTIAGSSLPRDILYIGYGPVYQQFVDILVLLA